MQHVIGIQWQCDTEFHELSGQNSKLYSRFGQVRNELSGAQNNQRQERNDEWS